MSVMLPMAVVLTAVTPANAQWAVKASGPDVFGNEKVIALVPSNSGDTLVVQCNQSDSLYVAMIERGTADELNQLSTSSGIPAELLVRVDHGPVQKFDAMLRQWNTRYLGIVASGRRSDIVALIRDIGAANQKIYVGTEIFGSQDSASFGVIGSGNAMSTVIKDCKLGDIKASPSGSGGGIPPSAH